MTQFEDDSRSNRVNISKNGHLWKKPSAEIRKRCSFTKGRFKAIVCSFFPFLTWMKEYDWKRDPISDLVAGVTVGVMSVPQGMSYAGVVGVPAMYGLYSNIFPTILYFFLGTSRLGAIGPPAVVSIMLGNVRHKHIPDSRMDFSHACYVGQNGTIYGADPARIGEIMENNPECFSSWQLVIATTMLVGLILVILGVLHLGFLSNYLSDHFVGGFTSGAAVHAMSSQVGYIFGIHLPWRVGIGKVILTYVDLFEHIHEAAAATLVISAISITALLISKWFLNMKFQRVFGAPLPAELALVLIGTAVSYFGQFQDRYNVETVHRIMAGFPPPMVPRIDLMRRVAMDAVYTAVVLYSLSISLAKLGAKRNDYKIDPNQEFFAFGSINIVGSFFQCFAAGQIVSRSMVYESAGAKSQFAGVYGSILVIVTVLWVAPLLDPLPKCILGSIIWVACMQMLRQLKQLKVLFSTDKFDFMIYLFSFLSVVLLNVTEGLLVSIVFAGCISLCKARCLKSCKSERSENGGPYQQLQNDGKISFKDRIFHFGEPLYFANADRFKRELYEKCGLSSDDLHQDTCNRELNIETTQPISVVSAVTDDHQRQGRPLTEPKLDYIILDCAGFAYIDSMGVRALRQVDNDLKKRGVNVYYVQCTGENRRKLETSQFLDDDRNSRVFSTAADATAAATAYDRDSSHLPNYGSTDGQGSSDTGQKENVNNRSSVG